MSALSYLPSNQQGVQKPRVQSSTGGAAICVEGTVPVQVSATNNVYQIPADIDQIAITQNFVTQGTAGAKPQMPTGTNPVSGTFDIYAKLCIPANATTIDPHSVQILTHGLGFDSTYWDVAEGFSYVDVAAKEGKVTLAYDRLSVGKSSKPDPIRDVQAPIEAAILAQLVSKLKAGHLASTKFQKVVSVGHSFGSALTVALVTMDPNAVDAVVLTGFSLNTTGLKPFTAALDLQIASRLEPLRFSELPNGYLIDGSASANQFGFFSYPGFPAENLALAERTKATLSLGELSGLGSMKAEATKFTGPVDVVNGEFDLPFCTGDCNYPTNQLASVQPMLFPQASKTSTTYIAPGAGHGLNLHYAAAAAYEHIQGFLGANGF